MLNTQSAVISGNSNLVHLRKQPGSKGFSVRDYRAIWMGTVRLWNHHLGSRNRTALYALVHPGIPKEPVDVCLVFVGLKLAQSWPKSLAHTPHFGIPRWRV